MKIVTQVQRENLLLAKAMWLNVPESKVSAELETWRIEPGVRDYGGGDPKLQAEPTCKTIACFGGWCAWVPAFMEQGVTIDEVGAPTFRDVGYGAPFVSDMLFGDAHMFFSRSLSYDPVGFTHTDEPSDWQIVMNRIDTLLANSEVV